jgi:hypothetical protein
VRLLACVVAAGAVLTGVAGCGGRADDAAPTPAPSVAARADDVGAAVQDAQQLLDDIDAELAADDASGD